MKYCMECGTELPDPAKFCSSCGLQLTDQAAVSWEEEDDQQPEHVPELHEPPVPAPPIEQASATQPSEHTAEPEPQQPRAPSFEPPVPVARHAFREPYVPESEREPAADAPVSFSSVLPWDDEERVDLVPPPASAYADEPPVEPVPPPASAFADEPPHDLEPPPPAPIPRYESYVVDEPAPPLSDGIEVPNIPPEPPTAMPAQRAKRPNWIMRHKLVAATTAVVSAVIIAAAVNSTGNTPGTTTTQSPGIQLSDNPGGSSDIQATVGSGVTIGGMQATVTAATPTPTLDETHLDGYLVVDVTYNNTSAQNKPYNSLDWKIQAPSGATTGSESIGGEGQLASGDLATNATVSGKLSFKIGAEKGEFQIIWKPDPVDPTRGIWKVPVA
jgi:hypothetical protein